MKIVATSDLHGFLPKMPPADLLLIAGDIVPRRMFNPEDQRNWLVKNFRPWLNSQDVKRILFTAGNHDLCLEDFSWAKDNFPEYQYLEIVKVNEVSIFFNPYSLIGLDLAFQTNQKEAGRIFKTIPPRYKYYCLARPD